MADDVVIDKRLIKTYFSKKPTGAALAVSAGTLLLCGVVSQLYWHHPTISTYLAASKSSVFDSGEYWRLFTTTFVHGDMGHLLGNAYMLGILGFFVYAYFGVWIFPLASSLLAGLVNAITIWAYPPKVNLIGASGMVYFLAGFWLTLFIFIERKRHFTRRILIASGVGLLILFPTTFEENVSYRAHAVGLLVGIIFGIFYFALNRKRIRQAEVWKVIVEVHSDEVEEPPITL